MNTLIFKCFNRSALISAKAWLLALALLLAMPTLAMSEKQEIKIGKEMHEEILSQSQVYPDEEVQAYVDRLGQRLAALSERPHLEWHFTVLDNPEINAFATPGGYVYINSGLMMYLKTEAELAGVLGHEIGHITGRHASRQKSAAGWSKALSTIAAIAVGISTNSADAAQGTQNLGNLAGTAMVRGYGRDMELEADEAGARYLLAGGYDPNAMIDVIAALKDQQSFARLKARESGKKAVGYHGLFSTHPRNDDRLKNVIRKVGVVEEGAELRGEDGAFELHMENFKFLDSRINTHISGSRYYNRPMDFTVAFPAGWEVQPKGASIFARSYQDNGLMQLRVKRLKDESMTPQSYLKQAFNLSGWTEEEELSLPDKDADFKGVSVKLAPSGRQSVRRAAAIFHNGRAFLFTAKSENAGMEGFYDTLFSASIQSFRPLDEYDRSIALAQKLKYVQVTEGMTFAKLAEISPIKHFAEQELRLLNGYYPRGEPEPGDWIRVVDK